MGDMSSQSKSTPTHPRQHGRANGRPGAHKAYASENDVASLDASRHGRAPQTPEKAGPGSPAPTDSNTAQTGPKQRNRTRPKIKNAPTSPDSAQRGRQTPPHPRSVSLKPGTSTAFAGATFHASPAPSALPIPSFLAKSSADTPVHGDSRDIVQEPSPPATDTDAPTPFRPSSVPRTRESPLDFMFRAHREERERQHRSSMPLGQGFDAPNTISPPSHSQLHAGPSNCPNQTRRTSSRQLLGGIDSSELDGTPGLLMGPAFSTPYQDRIMAARSSAPRSHSDRAQQLHKILPADDPTEALKKFLFGGGSELGQATPKTTASAPVAQVRGRKSTTQTDRPEPARANNIQAMENDLRKILKLDLTSDSASPDRGLFSR